MRFSYHELQSHFAAPLPGVEAVSEALTAHAFEVDEILPKGDDWELEVKVLPDRAADAKSPLGLAHEMHAILNVPLKETWAFPVGRPKLAFMLADINNLLGLDLTKFEMTDLLGRVRVRIEEEGIYLKATIPDERKDLNIKEDLADEIIRLLGYDHLPAKILAKTSELKQPANYALANKVREHFVSAGYTEVYGYTFTNRGELEVEKPLAADKNFLRTNLADGLKRILELNLQYPLFDAEEVKLFEIGTVFTGGAEELHVAVAVGSRKPAKAEVTENKLADWTDKAETVGNLAPFINLDVAYQPFSSYPRIVRDIALFVPPAVEPQEVAELIKSQAGNLLVQGPTLFDVFEKEGRKSLAFRLVFQSFEKTLSDEEVNAVMDGVTAALKEKGWEVR